MTTAHEHSRLAVHYLKQSFKLEELGDSELAAKVLNLSNDHCNAAIRQLNEQPLDH